MSKLFAIIIGLLGAAAADRTPTIDTFTGPRAHLSCTCEDHPKEGYNCDSCSSAEAGVCECIYKLRIYE